MGTSSMYCSQSPGCICEKCLYYCTNRCPYGNCYDDLRAKENPYDKAHPKKTPRTSWSNWREDQAYWCRGGLFYQSYKCDRFVEYDESKTVVKDCLETVIEIYQDGYMNCSLVDSVGCQECYRRLEENIEMKEGEALGKTYYTKCGREFKKSSTAAVTGYKISETYENGRDQIDNNECVKCPFANEVTDGWGENKKHIRFECRAGSKKPSQENDWYGSLEDKLTIRIHSLHHAFLESVMKYCRRHPELSASYKQDAEDCRRVISVLCSQNRKGIAAKKELVGMFFGAVETEDKKEEPVNIPPIEKNTVKDKALLSALIGKKIITHYNAGGIVTKIIGPHNAYIIGPHNAYGPGTWTINYTKDGKKSKNPYIINSIKIENGVITCEGKPLQIIGEEKHPTGANNEEVYIYRGLV